MFCGENLVSAGNGFKSGKDGLGIKDGSLKIEVQRQH